MATEEQVLTLTTEFNDQATAAIAGVRDAIAQLSGPAVREAQRRMNEGMGEFEGAIRNLGREALGVGRAFGDLVKVIGPMPVAVGLAGFEIGRIIRSSEQWASGIVDMGNAARLAGLSFGQFKGIADQLERGGLGLKEISSGLTGFNRAYAEMMTSGAKRAEIMELAGHGFAQNMARALLQLRGITDEVGKLNAVRQLGINIFDNLKEAQGEDLARQRQLEFYAKFHADFLINVQKALTQEDVKRLQSREELSTKALALNAALVEQKQLREDINNKWNEFIAGPETTMIKLLIDIEKNILARMEQTTHAFSGGQAAPARPGQTSIGPSGGWGSAFGMGKPASAPSTAPQDLGGSLGLGAIPGGPAPGPATGATKFYGLTDAADDGGGSIADNWRQSENVEDNRQQVDQNTNQVRQLNDNLQRILSLTKPGGGVAPGGAGGGGLAGQLGLGDIGRYGGGGGGGGGGRGGGLPGGPGDTTGPTTPVPPPPMGATGAPLGGVMGGQPFGINVSPEKFQQITGLPAAFMNVSPRARAVAAGISTGGPGLGGEFTGQKTQAGGWPTVAGPGGGGGYGAGGTVTGTGASISGATSIANLERNSQAQAAIARFAAENPNVTDAKTQLYSLVQGESGFGRDMSPGRRYSGYFQMGQEETFAATGQHISGSQLAAMSFDQQLDIYSKWVHHASPNATNLGLFNAASNPRFQTASDDTIVYHAGTAAAQQNASTWGKYSPGGPGGDITVGGIKKYYSRGDPETNRAIAAAGTPAATTAQALVGAPGTGGVTVSPITGGVPAGIGPTVGGTTGIRDDNGKEVDHQTLAGAMAIAKTGNAPAMKQYLAQHGFSLDATACGAIATRFANLSGVKPPPASAVASSWLAWGTRVNPDVIDRAGMELGTLKLVSPVGTYMHVGQPLTPGEQGGHVMTIVPGTYNDKNGSVQVIDQYGVHSENVNKMQVRYAGDPAGTVETPVATASDTGSSGAWPKDAMTEDARKTIDNITAQRDDPGPANIKLNVVHKNAPSDVSVKADGDAFKGHSMEQTNKAPTPAKAPSHEFSGAELAAG